MLADDVDAATVAFEVGYESASQFNREYSRLFGQPPIRDVRTLRSAGAPRARINRHGLAKCFNEDLVAGIQLTKPLFPDGLSATRSAPGCLVRRTTTTNARSPAFRDRPSAPAE